MNEEGLTPTDETTAEPAVFSYFAGEPVEVAPEISSDAPLELEYTPDGWVIKK